MTTINHEMRAAVAKHLNRAEGGLRSALALISSPAAADERLEDALNEVQDGGFAARRAFRLERNIARTAPPLDQAEADADDEVARIARELSRQGFPEADQQDPGMLRAMAKHMDRLAELLEREH